MRRTGCRTEASRPTPTVSINAAQRGTGSLISPGPSCPSACVNGFTGSDQRDLVSLSCRIAPSSLATWVPAMIHPASTDLWQIREHLVCGATMELLRAAHMGNCVSALGRRVLETGPVDIRVLDPEKPAPRSVTGRLSVRGRNEPAGSPLTQ
jgi:hypothetical protein